MATNIVSTTITTDTGDYLFTALPIGAYTVKIELYRIPDQIDAGFHFSTGDRVRVDAALEAEILAKPSR